MNLAFVLLKEARLPDGEEVARAFASFEPGAQQLRSLPGEGREILEFEMSPGETAFVALMPVAVPGGEAEEAAPFSMSTIGAGWKPPAHQAHLVVTIKTGGSVNTTAELSRFTSLLAAVAQATEAVGVYWGGAGATHDANFFVELAREPAMRTMLWSGVSIAQEAGGRVAMLSLGMGQLGLPNLLLTAPQAGARGAMEWFFDLLGYVAERGEALPEGDTIGRDENERLFVHYVPSPIDADTKVWRIEIG